MASAAAKWDAALDGCRIGAIEVRRVVDIAAGLYDPAMMMPATAGTDLGPLAKELGPRHIDPDTLQFKLSFHSYLLRTGKLNILVDCCCGNDKERLTRPPWHHRKGDFIEQLARAGCQPGDIDIVFCTHLHADHVGWNTKLENGRWVPTFPNARYLMGEKEYRHWKSEHDKCTPEAPLQHGSFADSVLPVIESGQADMVQPGHVISPSLSLELVAGHTPGLLVLNVSDGGQGAVMCGDVLHHPVQLRRPEWSTGFCSDPVAAAKSRREMLDHMAGTGALLLPAHFQPPDYGAVEHDGEAYVLDLWRR